MLEEKKELYPPYVSYRETGQTDGQTDRQTDRQTNVLYLIDLQIQ